MVLTTRLYCFWVAGEIFMLINPYTTQLNFVTETDNLQIKTQKILMIMGYQDRHNKETKI